MESVRAGHARPLRGGGRVRGCGVVSGHLCRGRRPRRAAEGSRPLPTVWGETGWQSSNGWLWKACGPGMPGPYGVAEGCAGVGWFRAIFVGGGVLDVPRRGQDPSLRCGVRRGGKAVTGGGGKRAGRACPAPTGVVERSGWAGINFRRVSLSPNLYTSVTCFPLM